MQSGVLLFRKELISWGPFIIPSLSFQQDSSLAKLRRHQSVLVLRLLFLDSKILMVTGGVHSNPKFLSKRLKKEPLSFH